jgi:mono/diheme cytochrome c family protein
MTWGIALVLLGVLGAGRASATPALLTAADLVAEGERHWTTSPVPGDPVACATCHHDPDETRGWAASYPKFRALPPPDGRVMTLLQATAAAVRRHYELEDPERAALAVTAYLTSRGARIAIAPGVVDGQPVFEARLRALAISVARGRQRYARQCGGCHTPTTVAGAVARFPRVVEGQAQSLERFIAGHRPGLHALRWDSSPIADVIAFLTSHLAGVPVGAPAPTPARARRDVRE